MTPKELEQAIQLDIGDILKLPANGDTQSVYHSYEVLNQGEKLDVLVVGCTRAFLDPCIAMIKAADLEPVVIDVAAFNLPDHCTMVPTAGSVMSISIIADCDLCWCRCLLRLQVLPIEASCLMRSYCRCS